MVVAECYVRYKSPAFYEDVLTVRTRVAEMRSRSVRFIYEVYRESDQVIVAEGETVHLVTDDNKKVRVIPEIYRQLLMGDDAKAFPPDLPPS